MRCRRWRVGDERDDKAIRNGGWEVDISVSYADGSSVRERKKAPASSRSGAKRWGEARERELLLLGPNQPRKDVPTLAEFWPRFVDGYARASRHKPSGIESKKSHVRTHLVGPLGDKRLDRIGDEDVQQLKGTIDGGNKTANRTPDRWVERAKGSEPASLGRAPSAGLLQHAVFVDLEVAVVTVPASEPMDVSGCCKP